MLTTSLKKSVLFCNRRLKRLMAKGRPSRQAIQRRVEFLQNKRNGGNPNAAPPPASPLARREKKKPKPTTGYYQYCTRENLRNVLLILFPAVLASGLGYRFYQYNVRERMRVPLTEPLIRHITHDVPAEFGRRLWGTYRSHVYFGFKVRRPVSPALGLMWMAQNLGEEGYQLRHWCDQRDEIPVYAWMMHDGLSFGVQQIQDKYVQLHTSFVKRPKDERGGDWTADIQATPLKNGEHVVISVFFYFYLEGDGHIGPSIQTVNNKGVKLDVIKGYTPELGSFEVSFHEVNMTNSMKHKFDYMVASAHNLSVLTDFVQTNLRQKVWVKDHTAPFRFYGGLPGHVDGDSHGNFMVYQLTALMPFHIQIMYRSTSTYTPGPPLIGPVYQQELNQHMAVFDEQLDSKFRLQKNGYDNAYRQMARVAISNMLGSLGYFYGESLVASKGMKREDALTYWKAPLFTAVPSRSFFPRGFLWDEGFHNLLIEKWDLHTSMEIIGHWLDLLNIDGWIPREQILGIEAAQKVPAEYIVQWSENANPPTLFLPLVNIVKKLIAKSDPIGKDYLEALFPRLKVWYNWFNTTQVGVRPGTYRWRGRDADTEREVNPKTMASGLDDYPRSSHPTEQEYHLDLRCWMVLASEIMVNIGEALNRNVDEYRDTFNMLSDNKLLDILHWSPERKRYADYGLHTDAIRLERPKVSVKPGHKHAPQPGKIRVVKKEPIYGLVDSHFGYNSLFPLLMKVIEPTSSKLGILLEQLLDENLLWTQFGLRSLARNSPLYRKHNTEHDPPYWRGNIWINMNYLALRALHHYANVEGPYKSRADDVYVQLRSNVVTNMFEQFKVSGYIYENYNDVDGKGQGCYPFTGWSSLVVAIMAEYY